MYNTRRPRSACTPRAPAAPGSGWAGAAGSAAVAAPGWPGRGLASPSPWPEWASPPGRRCTATAASPTNGPRAASWPRLAAHVALDDPSPVLATQLWDRPLLVGERSTARQLRQDLVV